MLIFLIIDFIELNIIFQATYMKCWCVLCYRVNIYYNMALLNPLTEHIDSLDKIGTLNT